MTRLEFSLKVLICFILPVILYEYFANEVYSFFEIFGQEYYQFFFFAFVGCIYFLLFRLIYLQNKDVESKSYLFDNVKILDRSVNKILGKEVLFFLWLLWTICLLLYFPIVLFIFLFVQISFKKLPLNLANLIVVLILILPLVFSADRSKDLSNDQVISKSGVRHIFILKNYWRFDSSYQQVKGKYDEKNIVLKAPVFIFENLKEHEVFKKYHLESLKNNCVGCLGPNDPNLSNFKIHYEPSGSEFKVVSTLKEAKHGILNLGLELSGENYVLLKNKAGGLILENEGKVDLIIKDYNKHEEADNLFFKELLKIFHVGNLTMQLCGRQYDLGKPEKTNGHPQSEKSPFLEVRLLTFFKEFRLLSDVKILEISNFKSGVESNQVDCVKLFFKKPEPLYLLSYYGEGWNLDFVKIDERKVISFQNFDYDKISQYSYERLVEYSR